MRPNVLIPIFHITIDPCVNATRIECADIARKDEVPFAWAKLRLDQFDGCDGLLICPNLDLLLASCTIDNAVDGKSNRGDACNEADQSKPARRDGGDGFRVILAPP